MDNEQNYARGDFAECYVAFFVLRMAHIMQSQRVWVVEDEYCGLKVDGVLEHVGSAFLCVVLEAHLCGLLPGMYIQ